METGQRKKVDRKWIEKKKEKKKWVDRATL